MRASPPVVVAGLLAAVTYGARARAHFVPGDPDPGRTVYLMPGPIVSLVTPLRGDGGSMLMDLGVEVSAHRFVPTSRRVWSQVGYGAFAQAQLGGVLLQRGDALPPSLHLRLALGGQVTFGVLGACAGLSLRTPGAVQAGAFGAFAGVFFSVGLTTAAFVVELPMAHFSDGAERPALFTGTILLKWPISIGRD